MFRLPLMLAAYVIGMVLFFNLGVWPALALWWAIGLVTGWLCWRLYKKLLPKRVPHYGGIEECKNAAVSGDARAQCTLAGFYERGEFGLPQDYAESAKWYRKAAEQNHGAAQLHLGVYLAEGKGVEKNVVEGLMWIFLARHVLAHNAAGWLLRDAAIQQRIRTEAQMTEQQIAEARVMLDSSPLYKEFKEMLAPGCQSLDTPL